MKVAGTLILVFCILYFCAITFGVGHLIDPR